MDFLVASLFLTIALALPFFRILKRAGLNPWFAAFLIIPVFGYLIVLGLLAFLEWPKEPEGYR